jgi:glycosyltransferase involved in cell wall biosynthesis
MTFLWIYNMPLVPEAGGTERITSLVAKGLTNLGHKTLGIMVFDETAGTMTYDGKPVYDLYAFLTERGVDIVINQIAYSRWLLAAFLERGGARWKAAGGHIISCLHFDPKPTSSLYFLRGLADKSLRHRLNVAKAFLLYPIYSARQSREIGATYNWIYDHSDRYVTLSERHFPYFKRVTRRSEYDKLVAINNPLTFPDISSTSILDSKRKVILVCSRMDEFYKRLSLVLKAWKQLQNKQASQGWHLKLVGDGPSLSGYKHYAELHGLKQVSFEGNQDPEPFYREASIFLLTSKNEGWGLTLTESLQHGVVPVVMNTCPVFEEIIEDGVNGYLTPGSCLKPFTERILSLMANKSKLRAMQRAALASSTRFTLPSTMRRWVNLLQNL